MAILVGSDEFTGSTTYTFQEEMEKKTPEEIKRELKDIKPVFIPERFIQDFLDDYDCVVVNDFGDDYHLSEKEREKKNKFYKTFKEYVKANKRQRTLKGFVEVMRMGLKCLDKVAEENGFYSPEQFKKLFLQGKLYVVGLQLPRLSGKEKKTISWDYLTEFILSDEPVENLVTEKIDAVYTPEELKEAEDILFDNIDEIVSKATEEDEKAMSKFIDESDDVVEHYGALELSDKEMRKVTKAMPELVYGIKEARKYEKQLESVSRSIYDFTESDFDDIEKYEEPYEIRGKMPEFNGDLDDDNAYERYMYELDEYEKENIYVPYHGKFKSQKEINEIELRQLLESEDYNLRNLYGNKEREKKLDKIRKKEKKKIKKVKKRLIDLKKRKSRRMGDGDGLSTSSKKGNKSKKKKKKKAKKGSP